jgi:hypothetical protein
MYQKWQQMGVCCHKILRQCTNLKELHVESPTANYSRWAHGNPAWPEITEQPILRGMRELGSQRLSKLVLNLDGRKERYWDPNFIGTSKHSWAQVMALPSLVELRVSCALIHDKIHAASARSTCLRSLSLIECNITLHGLEKMLAAPRALEKLHIGMSFRSHQKNADNADLFL